MTSRIFFDNIDFMDLVLLVFVEIVKSLEEYILFNLQKGWHTIFELCDERIVKNKGLQLEQQDKTIFC